MVETLAIDSALLQVFSSAECCYVIIASAPLTDFPYKPYVSAWTVVSYQRTESAVVTAGMPGCICAKVDTHLDALGGRGGFVKRAVWFKRFEMQNFLRK